MAARRLNLRGGTRPKPSGPSTHYEDWSAIRFACLPRNCRFFLFHPMYLNLTLVKTGETRAELETYMENAPAQYIDPQMVVWARGSEVAREAARA